MTTSKVDYQKTISEQVINNELIYYSYANKYQAKISIFKNQRLLVFNSKTGMLYYINEPKSLPFKTQIPKPKNDCSADMNISLAKNPPGTNELIVLFSMKNEKNQRVDVQWNFLMDNNALAVAWINVFKSFKDKKMRELQEAENLKNKPKQQLRSSFSRALNHDTVSYGLLGVKPSSNTSPPKPQQVKKEPSPKKQQPPKQQPKKLQPKKQQPKKQPPKIQDPRKSQPNNNIQGSQQQKPPSVIVTQPKNLGDSKFSNQNTQNINPTIKPIPNIPTPTKPNPNPTPINNTQLRNSMNRRNQNNSVVFRDELQSIISKNRTPQGSRMSNNNYAGMQSRIFQYRPENDWNLKFYTNQSQEVLVQFQKVALQAFYSVIDEDVKSNQPLRIYLKPGVIIYVADARTIQAKKIKSEFRNFHFIVQSTKSQFIVGVPISVLIEFQGLVAVVKALIPETAPKLQLTQQIILDLKDLQRYTRIKNNILKKATLYDLSQIYQSRGKRLIYINQLIQYLPIHVEQSYQGGSLRPQHILDNVQQFMQGGLAYEATKQDMKTLNQTLQSIKVNQKQLAKELSSQDITFANGLELKDIMHSRGINLKHLPILYSQVTNKTTKKYIHTFMVAKIVKDDILENIAQIRAQSTPASLKQTLEKSIKLLIEGNSNVLNELWKQIAVNFRKEYSTPMSNHDIIGPFLLDCVMGLLPAKYDLSKLDRKRVFFKDDNILAKGFVVELLPKIKSFYRFTTQMTEKVMSICKDQKNIENYQFLIDSLQLQTKTIPAFLSLSKTNKLLKQYLSNFICPAELDPKSFPNLKIYDCIGLQPPTGHSLLITKNYLGWCLETQQYDEFKEILEFTIKQIDFWYDSNHVFHCEFYQLLAKYHERTGTLQDSINYIKESLALCIRTGGVNSKKAGQKYFALAQKQLKIGRKAESLQNFNKAKNNMELSNSQSPIYPMTLMKLSSLYLNSSDFDNCVIYAKQAVQKFEGLQNKKKPNVTKGHYDQYCIKSIEIMTRAFEIQGKKNEFYKIAQLSSAKYNRTPLPQTFLQMVKICLTAVIFKNPIQKCQVFQSFIEKLITQGEQAIDDQQQAQRSFNQLLTLRQQFNVMERFMFKFQSLERIVSDVNSRRPLSNDSKQFVQITKSIVGAVGEDYVLGLIQQKQVE